MHDQIAADDPQAAVGTIEANVFRAVLVDGHGLGGEGVRIGAESGGGASTIDQALRADGGRRLVGGGEGGSSDSKRHGDGRGQQTSIELH